MPSGYTAYLQEHPKATLEQFVALCARAMGALIHMRDDPSDTPLPEKIPMSSWHADQIAVSEVELAKLHGMGAAEREKTAAEAWEGAEARRLEREKDRLATRATYESMLAQVRAWQPPTPDHEGLKNFMISQITESIAWDCDDKYDEAKPRPTFEEWYEAREKALLHDIEYHKKGHAEEVARVEGRQKWLDDLRASIAPADRPATSASEGW